MAELRIPGYSEGSDIGGEPVDWLIYDTETKERRIEMNPNYVPPPEPTEIQLAEWAVAEAERDLEEAKAHLLYLMDSNQQPSGSLPAGDVTSEAHTQTSQESAQDQLD